MPFPSLPFPSLPFLFFSRGVSPADMPNFGASGAEAEFDPEMMGFLSYGNVDNGIFGGGAGDGDSSSM